VAWGDRVERVAAAPADVVDCTGAGDAFAAGFAVAYATTRDPVAGAQAGALAAAAVVARLGAR
jgi:sugar/nucleoside kinase (ribokinase family)